MGQKEKLIEKLLSKPRNFTFNEAEMLLGYFSYCRSNKGKTSGSHVMFTAKDLPPILLHKPHTVKKKPRTGQLFVVKHRRSCYSTKLIF